MTEYTPLSYQAIADTLNAPVCRRIREVITASSGRHGAHIAVTGNLYSGRDRIIAKLAGDFPEKSTIHTFSSPVADLRKDLEPYAVSPLLFINNAQYLASRRIGGFSQLEAFLEFLAETESTVISGWNTSAWNYCAAVTGMDAYHAKIIDIPPFTPDHLQEVVDAAYGSAVTYINDATLLRSFVESDINRKLAIPFTDRKISIPWISFDSAILKSALSRKERERSPKGAVLSRIARVAQGNPCVAAEVWNASIDYPAIRLSRIHEPPVVASLTIDERHVLASILMLEAVTPAGLGEIHGKMAGVALHMLRSRDIVEEKDGQIRIRPILANSVLTHLRGLKGVP